MTDIVAEAKAYLDDFQRINDSKDQLNWLLGDNGRQFIGLLAQIATTPQLKHEYDEILVLIKTQLPHGMKLKIIDIIENKIATITKTSKYDRVKEQLDMSFEDYNSKMVFNKHGQLVYCPVNISNVLEYASEFKLAFDNNTRQVFFTKMPWQNDKNSTLELQHYGETELTQYFNYSRHNSHNIELKIYLDKHFFHRENGFSDLDDHVAKQASRNGIDTNEQWILSREGIWDGVKRFEGENNWMRTCLGVEVKNDREAKWVDEVARVIMLSIVWRSLSPGCVLRVIPVLEGPQGVGKTRWVASLAPHPDWYTTIDFHDKSGTREITKRIIGRTIVEIPELGRITLADQNMVKEFLSARNNIDRPLWKQEVFSIPRRNVFIITTNEYESYLMDQTGNIRYVPIVVGNIDQDKFDAIYPQLLAEAITWYRAGQEPFIIDHDLHVEQLKKREYQTKEEVFLDYFFDSLTDELRIEYEKNGVHSERNIFDFFTRYLPSGDTGQKPEWRDFYAHRRAIASALRKRGWERAIDRGLKSTNFNGIWFPKK